MLAHFGKPALVFPLSFCVFLLGCGQAPPEGPGGGGGAGGSAGEGGGGGGAGGDKPVDFLAMLTADGFEIQEGALRPAALSDCCESGKSCAGDDPSRPYSAYFLPRAPGQTVENPGEDVQGLSSSYRLRPDEAVVWLGETPPAAAYFGVTDYLVSRDDGTGKRVPVFASLAETLNIGVIGVAGPPDGVKSGRLSVIVHAADASIAARVLSTAVASGVPAQAINIAPIDAGTARLGLAEDDDALGVVLRADLFEDPSAGSAWLAAPPVQVLRLTPTSVPGAPAPYGEPPARAKDTKTDEKDTYAEAVEALKDAILASYTATHAAVTENVSTGAPDAEACIEELKSCSAADRDTLYPSTGAFPWLPKEEDFLIVYGVNHAASGKATYASAGVLSIDHLARVATVTSDAYAGSASKYLPDHPLAGALYAYKFARSCNGEAYCVEVPAGSCPDGISPAKLAAVTFRVHLEPSTATAPDPLSLVRDGVLRFQAK